MPIPTPKSGESQKEFVQRCMEDPKMKIEYAQDQRAAICYDAFLSQLAAEKVSFDYDGTLSTEKGKQRALNFIENGADVYIISAREEKDGMLNVANRLGIPESRVYATGNNEAKIEKIKELGITIHYDNNEDVVNALPNIGRLLK